MMIGKMKEARRKVEIKQTTAKQCYFLYQLLHANYET